MPLDVITAIRQLRQAPGTAVSAILTLAIGIGATTGMLSFVTAVLSTGAPAPDMDRLVGLWSHNRIETETKGLVSPGDFLDWSARARSFEAVAAMRRVSFNVSGTGTPARVGGSAVTPAYFDVLRWSAARGRRLTAEDARPGAPRVAVASHTFWRNTLAAREDVVGHVLRLDGEPTTIVGVLPRVPAAPSLLVPLMVEDDRDERSARALFVWARLASRTTIEHARHEMELVGDALAREFPATNQGWGVNTQPLQEEFIGSNARLVFALLGGTVITVLIIGCVNISNLLLARGVARRGEFAVRLALGAGAWRLARQLLIECGVLALFGAIGSIAVSRWTLAFLRSGTAMDLDSPWLAGEGLNMRAFALIGITSVGATLLAGLAPALAVRRVGIVSALQTAGRSAVAGSRRMARVLVAAQVALAVTLLVVAGLAARTLAAIENLEPGFDMTNVLTAAVTLPEQMPPEAAARWIDQALTRARQLPGVRSAGATTRLPFAGGRWNPNRGLVIEGQSAGREAEGRWAIDYVITPGYFETLRVGMVEGRSFSDADGPGAPLVAIVNQAMARRFWPDRTPLGARLRQGDEPEGQWRTVIGLVGDIRNDDADQPPVPYLYTPLPQDPVRTVAMTLRTANDPGGLAEPLRRAIADYDADQALYDVRTLKEVWEADLRASRILIQAMEALAAIGLGLAGLGVWGVAAHAVGQRTREIGVRMALGATAAQVGGLMARQGLLPVAGGLAVGLAGGLALGRLMRSILFQVSPTDPLTLVATLGALAVVGVAATLGPALRAARLTPLDALRE